MPPAKVRQVCKDFYGYSTLHGLHFLFDSPWIIRRIVWFVFLAGSTCTFLYFAYGAYRKYSKHEVFISTKNQREEYLKFPLVTICNANMLKKSKIIGKDGERYLKGANPRYRPQLSKIVNEMNKSFEIEKEVRTNGHQFIDIVKELKFSSRCLADGVNYTVKTYLETLRGLCHTITINNIVTELGEAFGLSLLLDAESHEYCGPYSNEGTGFKLLIHASHVYPTMEHHSIDIPTGYKTALKIRKRKKIYKENPYPKKCSSKKLKSSAIYSTSRCLRELSSYGTGEHCGCRIIGQPHISEKTKRYCTLNETITCAFEYLYQFKLDTKDCPTNCTEEEYDFYSSTLRYPSDSVWEDLTQGIMLLCRGNYNVSHEYKRSKTNNDSFQDWFRRRYARVNIYFHTKDVEVVEEIPAFDRLDFAGNLGGNMGLYLGCSFLTLVEFVDLIALVVIQWLKKKDNTVEENWAEQQQNPKMEHDN